MPRPRPGRRTAARAALPSVTLLLAACGGTGLPVTGGPTPTATAAIATPRPDLLARLDDMPNGVAQLRLDAATRRIVARLGVTGLAPSAAHAVQLRSGACLQRDGGVLVTFATATSGRDGTLNTEVRATATTAGGIPGGTHLDLHLTADPASAAIACADVTAAAPTAAVAIYATPGSRPYGTASLRYDATHRSASIALALKGLAPAATHPVQVVAGSCTAPGAPLHDAGAITADAVGAVSATLVVANLQSAPPANGWVLVVRYGTTQAQPILCGTLARP